MRHHRRSRRLGVKTAHRLAMMRNLTLGLIEHGRIKTTVARAKVLRTFVEPLVTRLKDPSIANIRVASSQLPHRDAVLNLAHQIAPKFKDRPGGYLRILKLAGPRAGDAADMALVEWVDESLVNAYQAMKGGTKAAPAAKTAPKKKAVTAKTSAATEKKAAPKKTAKAAKKSSEV